MEELKRAKKITKNLYTVVILLIIVIIGLICLLFYNSDPNNIIDDDNYEISERDRFNSSFLGFENNNAPGSMVKSLAQNIYVSYRQWDRNVTVNNVSIVEEESFNEFIKNIDSNLKYTIKVTDYGQDGFITNISVKEK